jgi:hypothetical protein
MSTFLGNAGVVKVGSGTVAEVNNFSVNQTAAVTEDTSMGDTWTTIKTTQKSWNASISCHWDDTDSDGQVALTVGSEVALTLYPEGTASGQYTLIGNAIVTDIKQSQEYKGLVSVDFTCQGTGSLAIGVV